MKANKTAGKLVGSMAGKMVRLGSLLTLIINWGFWSKETETDYYASLEDGEAYISLTEKE